MYDSYDAEQQIIAFCFSSARVVPWLQTYASVINSMHFNYYFEHEVHWTLKKNSALPVPAVLQGIFPKRSSFGICPKARLPLPYQPSLGLPEQNSLRSAELVGSTGITQLKPLLSHGAPWHTEPLPTPFQSQQISQGLKAARAYLPWQRASKPCLPLLSPSSHINYN